MFIDTSVFGDYSGYWIEESKDEKGEREKTKISASLSNKKKEKIVVVRCVELQDNRVRCDFRSAYKKYGYNTCFPTYI